LDVDERCDTLSCHPARLSYSLHDVARHKASDEARFGVRQLQQRRGIQFVDSIITYERVLVLQEVFALVVTGARPLVLPMRTRNASGFRRDDTAARLCSDRQRGKREKRRHVRRLQLVRSALRSRSYRVANNNFDDATRFESRKLRRGGVVRLLKRFFLFFFSQACILCSPVTFAPTVFRGPSGWLRIAVLRFLQIGLEIFIGMHRTPTTLNIGD